MKRCCLFLLILFPLTFSAFSQQDSVQQVVYTTALQHLKQSAFTEATAEFSQLISAGFANKEVFVKRGEAYYLQNEFNKATLDFDESVKSRINTKELFEFRG